MNLRSICLCGVLALVQLTWSMAAAAQPPQAPSSAPFKYVVGTAYHILPETHSDESGYFSLTEALNHKIYVGTAKYGVNAYLVEFDPQTGMQRIVVDTHQLCGLNASGYAAQAKLHTRNFLGPSGMLYIGSKQGYRRGPEDTADYPGGYVMTYDPATDKAENLGMPMPGQGVIDVTADESRGLLYVVSCEDQHWLMGKKGEPGFRELGPLLAPYAITLVPKNGRAFAVTKDFELAEYDPETGKVRVRPLVMNGSRLTAEDLKRGPINWVLAPDGQTAYTILMTDSNLMAIDLHADSDEVAVKACGPLLDGKGFDSRGALAFGPDGRLHALIRADNTTGFGTGFLHHLVRYNPETQQAEDLGVLKIANPDFFDFAPDAEGKTKPWSHGYHTLPDGSLTPLHHHMALIVAHDGTVYATIIAPFTLLRIPPEALSAP